MYSNSKNMEKALQLISVDSLNHIILHHEATQFLRSLTGPISVICIAGPYRTGKSYLLNSLLGLCINNPFFSNQRSNHIPTSSQVGPIFFSQQSNETKDNIDMGFKIGKTVKSCTKGLWIYNRPLLSLDGNQKISNVVFVDSQGFGDVYKAQDTSCDYRILSIALMLADVLLFNSRNIIDTSSLQDLQKIMNLVKDVKGSSHKTNQNKKPDFHWILRDFHLQLINQDGEQMSPDQYLNFCLNKAPFSLQQTVKDIKNQFKSLHCHTLINPFSQNSNTITKPEFTAQILQLKKLLQPINSKQIDGNIFVEVIQKYVQQINKHSEDYRHQDQITKRLVLQRAYQAGQNYQVRLQCLELLNKQLNKNQQEFINLLSSGKPFEQLNQITQEIKATIFAWCSQNIHDCKQSKFIYEEIQSVISRYIESLQDFIQRSKKSKSINSPFFLRYNSDAKAMKKFIESSEPSISSIHEQPLNKKNSNRNNEGKLESQIEVHLLKLEINSLMEDKQCLQNKIYSLESTLTAKNEEYQQKCEQILKLKIECEQKMAKLQSNIKQKEAINNRNLYQLTKDKQILQDQILQLTKNCDTLIQENKLNLQKVEKMYQQRMQCLISENQSSHKKLQEQILHLREIYKSPNPKKGPESQRYIVSDSFQSEKVVNLQGQKKQKQADQNQINLVYQQEQLSSIISQLKDQIQLLKKTHEIQIQNITRRNNDSISHLQELNLEKIKAKDEIIRNLQQKIKQTCKQVNSVTQQLLIRSENYNNATFTIKQQYQQQIYQIEKAYQQLITNYELMSQRCNQKNEQIFLFQEQIKLFKQQSKINQQSIKKQFTQKVQGLNYLLQQKQNKLADIVNKNQLKQREVQNYRQNIEKLTDNAENNKKLWGIVREGYEEQITALRYAIKNYRTMLQQSNISINLINSNSIDIQSSQYKQNQWQDGCSWGVHYQKQIEKFQQELSAKYRNSKYTAAISVQTSQFRNEQVSIKESNNEDQPRVELRSCNLLSIKVVPDDDFQDHACSNSRQDLAFITQKSIQCSQQQVKIDNNIKKPSLNVNQFVGQSQKSNKANTNSLLKQQDKQYTKKEVQNETVTVNRQEKLKKFIQDKDEEQQQIQEQKIETHDYEKSPTSKYLGQYYSAEKIQQQRKKLQKQSSNSNKNAQSSFLSAQQQKLHEQQIQFYRQANQNIKQQLFALKQQYRITVHQLQEKNMMYKQIRQENQILKNNIEEYLKTIKNNQADFEKFYKQQQQSDKKYLEKQYREIKEKLEEKIKQISVLNESMNVLKKSQEKNMKNKISEHNQLKQQANIKLQSKNNQLSALNEKYRMLNSEYNTLKTKNSFTEQQLVQKKQEFEYRIKKMQAKNKEKANKNEIEWKKDRANYLIKNQQLQKENKSFKEYVNQLQKQNKNLQEELNHLSDYTKQIQNSKNQEIRQYERALRMMKVKIVQLECPQENDKTCNQCERLKLILEVTRKNYDCDFQLWAQKMKNFQDIIRQVGLINKNKI